MTLKIANGAGFLGDNLDAPRTLVESAPVDYLTLEYLAELTLSILARQKEKDSQAGYAVDFLTVLESLCPSLQKQPQLRIVTNAGGVNPLACVARAAVQLADAGLGDLRVAVVTGDELTADLDQLMASGCPLTHLDTGERLGQRQHRVVSAHAYLGAGPIVEALAQDARVVITGRVADASLTVAPAVAEFGWSGRDWDQLAGATVAGHLIECGAQVTGGYDTRWSGRHLADIGYPIAELSQDSSCVITKPPRTGGIVSRQTVTQQLVYEIGDPHRYVTPDVEVDFTTVEVESEAAHADRVRVRGARGRAASDSYKVALACRNGYTASGQLLVFGRDCRAKARACAELVLRRLERAGYCVEQTHVELLGTGAGVPGFDRNRRSLQELVLRISVRDRCREAVERFSKELAPLITSGPAGLAGYAVSRSPVRPVLLYWPTLIEKSRITPQVEVRTANQWRRKTKRDEYPVKGEP